jgi:hypothetical protein
MENKLSDIFLNIPEEVLSSGIGATSSGTEYTVKDYFKDILENSKPLEPEFAEVVTKHFWDILA